jgi:hypothetical protein
VEATVSDYQTNGNGTARTRLASAGDDLSSAAKTVKEDAARLADTAKEEIQRRAEGVKENVQAKAEEGKSAAAESLETFAAAIRRAGDDLKDHDQTTTARLVSEAANGLESFSRMLNEKSVDGVIDSVRSFARANPTAFIAGSVIAGVALGRFIRSSSQHQTSRAGEYGTRGNGDYAKRFAGSEESGTYAGSSAWAGSTGSSSTGSAQSGSDRTRRSGDSFGEGEWP